MRTLENFNSCWAHRYRIETLGTKYPRPEWVDGGFIRLPLKEENKSIWGFIDKKDLEDFINKYRKGIILRIYFTNPA